MVIINIKLDSPYVIQFPETIQLHPDISLYGLSMPAIIVNTCDSLYPFINSPNE